MMKMRLGAGPANGVGALGVAFLLAVTVVACGGDDEIGGTADASADANGDASIVDSSTDGSAGAADARNEREAGGSGGSAGILIDSGPDATDTGAAGGVLRDGGADADAALLDASDAREATASDAGPDAAAEAGPDSGPDAADGGVEAEAGPAITIEQYQHAQSAAWCSRLGNCCALGAQFDEAKCERFMDTNYGPDNLAGYLQQYNGNFAGIHAVFSAAQAAQCVSLLGAKTCAQTGESKRQIFATCQLAVQGLLSNGASGCKTSLECAQGYCELPTDGGLGTCRALSTQGQSCSDPNFNADECVYQGISSPTSLHCQTTGTTSTCQPGLGAAQDCSFIDQSCASGICSQVNVKCVTEQSLGEPYCAQFTKAADAGGGG